MIIVHLKFVKNKQKAKKAINVEPDTCYGHLFLGYMVF